MCCSPSYYGAYVRALPHAAQVEVAAAGLGEGWGQGGRWLGGRYGRTYFFLWGGSHSV